MIGDAYVIGVACVCLSVGFCLGVLFWAHWCALRAARIAREQPGWSIAYLSWPEVERASAEILEFPSNQGDAA